MKLSKLRRIHVIIIGSVVWVLLGVGLFFILIKPSNEILQQETARYESLAPDATPEKARQAELALENAKKVVAQTEAQFDAILAKKMPNLRFDERDKGMIQLWHEQIEVLGPLIEKYIKKSGVTLLSDIQVPAPPVNPNDPLFSQDYFTVPIGTVTVRGGFKEILNHIRDWNKFNRLVQIDMPTLEGPSPILTSSYNLTVYVFPRKTAKDAPVIAMAGTGTTGPGGGVTVGVPPPGGPMSGPMGPGPMGPGPMGPMGPMGPSPGGMDAPMAGDR